MKHWLQKTACVVMGTALVAVVGQCANAQHVHVDAAGHLTDHRGHHVDSHGHHIPVVGVYRQPYYPQPVIYEQPYVYPQQIQPPMNQQPVVQPAIPSNTVPYSIQTTAVGAVPSGNIIKLVNPAESGGDVRYALNGTVYSIKPGNAQTLQNDRAWLVEFNTGGPAGNARYTLQPGTYKFKVTNDGWNLFKSQDRPSIASLPPAPVPEPFEDDAPSVRVPITQP